MEPKDLEQGKRIGQGQFSDVFEGQSKTTLKIYALKIIRPFRVENDYDFSKRILTELDVCKRLRGHPNVAEFFGHDKTVEDGWMSIRVSMELCCKDLKKYQEEAPGGSLNISDFLYQTCQGLMFIHEKRIVHRDIKPENILVNDENGKPTYKLTDFNMSFMTEAASLSNESMSTVGNRKYMAPEMYVAVMESRDRLKGQLYQVDVYSLGAVTCWLKFDGKLPYDRPDDPDLDNVIGSYFDTHWQQSTIAVIVKSMMVKNPKHRRRLDLELLSALKSLISNPEMQLFQGSPQSTISCIPAPLTTSSNNVAMATANNFPKYIKCVVVGDSDTGKKELCLTFSAGNFPTEYVPNVFHDYQVDISVDGSPVTLGIFDTSGDENYDRVRSLSYPQTDVFVLLVNVVSPSTHDSAEFTWVPEIRHHCPGVPVLLVGTHIDLREDQKVLSELEKVGEKPKDFMDGKLLAEGIGAEKYMECSAKRNHGVNEVSDS